MNKILSPFHMSFSANSDLSVIESCDKDNDQTEEESPASDDSGLGNRMGLCQIEKSWKNP